MGHSLYLALHFIIYVGTPHTRAHTHLFNCKMCKACEKLIAGSLLHSTNLNAGLGSNGLHITALSNQDTKKVTNTLQYRKKM